MRLLISGTMVVMAMIIYLIIAPVMIEKRNIQIDEKNEREKKEAKLVANSLLRDEKKEFETTRMANTLQAAMEGYAAFHKNIYTDNEKHIMAHAKKHDYDTLINIQFGKKANLPGKIGIIFLYQGSVVVDYIINGIGIDGQEIIILTKDKFL